MFYRTMSVVALLNIMVLAGCAATNPHSDTQFTSDGNVACKVVHQQKVRMYKGVTPQIIKSATMYCECTPGTIGFFGIGATKHECRSACAAVAGGCEVCRQHPNIPVVAPGALAQD